MRVSVLVISFVLSQGSRHRSRLGRAEGALSRIRASEPLDLNSPREECGEILPVIPIGRREERRVQIGQEEMFEITANFVRFLVALCRALFSPFFTVTDHGTLRHQAIRTETVFAETTTTTTRGPSSQWVSEVREQLVRTVRTRNSDVEFLRVRRNFAFRDALPFLLGPVENLRNWDLRVRFEEESGIGNGVLRDWLSEVGARTTRNGSLFERGPEGFVHIRSVPVDAPPPCDGSSCLPFRVWIPKIFSNRNRRPIPPPNPGYQAIGRLLGFCFMNQHQLPIQFSNLFFAKLLSKPLTVDMIKDEDGALFTSLSALLNIKDEEELRWIEITINDVAHQVTLENKEELVRQKLESMVGPEDLFQLIQSGFNQVFPIYRIRDSPIDVENLKLLLVGSAGLNVDELLDTAKVYGRYSETTRTEQMGFLRETLKSFSVEDQRLFLRFVRSSPQIPFGGFKAHPITINLKDASEALPTASTCSTALHLPTYSSMEKMFAKLQVAIRENQGLQD
jgi:hypothetical protein